MKKILVTGAMGQIGTELISVLNEKYNSKNVFATDIKAKNRGLTSEIEDYIYLDCTDINSLNDFVTKNKIDTIYHLVAILSASAEKKPQAAWHVNMISLLNVLETARENKCSIFIPSSIAVFGHNSPVMHTPQDTIQRPETMYGITKAAGEMLCDYYYKKYNVDTRGVRYPGIVSYKTLPGGGTTDYAVDIYYKAVREKKYECYLRETTYLDFMYMPDAVKAAINLMETDPAKLKHRNAYNVTSMSITPKHIADEIKKIIPEFEISYKVDPERQSIADTWPKSINDYSARKDWDWKPDYDLKLMSADMIENLSKKLKLME